MWIAILILLLLLLVLLIWVFLTPLVIYVDSTSGECYISLKGIFKAFPSFAKDKLKINFSTPFGTFDADRLTNKALKSKSTPKRKEKATSKRQKQSKSFRPILKLVYRLLKTFQVKRCELNLDTNDFVLNSWLFPIFFFASRNNVILKTNYQGDFDLKLEIRNRLVYTLPPLFQFIFDRK